MFERLLSHRYGHAAYLLILIAPFFVRPATFSVWDSNEAFYVQTPREMVASGNWLVPTFNGRERLNKPPLSYWLVAVPYSLFGSALVWERLIMASAAAGSICCVFLTGRLLLGNPVLALAAAGILATTFRFMVVSRRLLIDILLLALVLAAVTAFCWWLQRGYRRAFLLFCCLLGLAFLSKGPVALLIGPALALLAWLSLGRHFPARTPWISGTLVLLAVSSSWFLALAWLVDWEIVFRFFFTENLGRFVNIDFGPRRGPFYYPGVFLGDFFPWSLLFFFVTPTLLAAAFRRRLAVPAFLLCWIATFCVFFSLSLNKQEYYILPVYPAAALGVAWFLGERRFPRWLLRSLAVLMGATALLLAVPAWSLVDHPFWALLPCVAMCLAAAAAWKAEPIWIPPALALTFFLALALWSPALERLRPVPQLAASLHAYLERSATERPAAGYYRLTVPSLRFYLDRDIHELFDLDSVDSIFRLSKEVYLLTDENGLEDLKSRFGNDLEVLEQSRRLGIRGVGPLFGNPGGAAEHWTRPVFLVRLAAGRNFG